MKKFVVFQDGKRCKDYGLRLWPVDSFETKREAEVFAYAWAYPVDAKTAQENAKSMVIGQEYDMSMHEEPVMMSIRETEE